MPVKGCSSAFKAVGLENTYEQKVKYHLQMVVFETNHVNHRGRTKFTIASRFYNFIWSLFFRIWNEYGKILAAEYDVNRGSSIKYISHFLRKTNIS